MRLPILTTTLLSLAAFDGCSPGASRCTAGQMIACTCTSGASGAQTCQPDGTYGTCRCSAGDGGVTDTADSGAAVDGAKSLKRVFVTSATYPADLKSRGGGATGLEGADKLCNDAAKAAKLGGTWRAWLSTSTTDAPSRMADVAPWYRLDGVLAFAKKDHLSLNPLVAINLTEHKTPLGSTWSWTGTDKGLGTKSNCASWTSSSAYQRGTVGIVKYFDSWSNAFDDTCDAQHHLYCFEQ